MKKQRKGRINMLISDILVILRPGASDAQYADTVRNARDNAASPALLFFLIPESFAIAAYLPEEVKSQVHFYTGDWLQAVKKEDWSPNLFLLLAAPSVFLPNWDHLLEKCRRTIGKERVLLTAWCFAQSQIRLPAFVNDSEKGLAVTKGIRFVKGTAPIKTMAACPAMLYGHLNFLRKNLHDESKISEDAFLTNHPLYALHQPIVRCGGKPDTYSVKLPDPLPLQGTMQDRFLQYAGLKGKEPEFFATVGLFFGQNTYSQIQPPFLERKKKAFHKFLHETIEPLFVSAAIGLQPKSLLILRLGFLQQMDNLPVVVFTAGRDEHAVRSKIRDCMSYPGENTWPAGLYRSDMNAVESFCHSKPYLLEKAVRMRNLYTHAAWIDPDILPYPVPASILPDYSEMMDDKIHLATVDGRPDPSFFFVPRNKIVDLVNLCASMTMFLAEMSRGYDEETLWTAMIRKQKDMFMLHRMPAQRMLFLSLLPREYLSYGDAMLLESCKNDRRK